MDIAAFDPGQRGAAALLRRDWNRQGRWDYRFLDMVDLPTIPDGETRKQIDVAFLGALLERWDPDVAVIENVQVAVARDDPNDPQQRLYGKRSAMSPSDAFRFGLACGMIRGVVMAYDIPVEMVHPRTWTLALGLKGGDKKPHIARIKQLVPTAANFITLAKHDGRADAGLMAYWHAQKTGFV
jgi:crossover junction endodeoxyribonuclease RuvC